MTTQSDRFRSRHPLIPIPRDELPDMVGKTIHLATADPGCVWILESIGSGVFDGVLSLRTPKSGKRIKVAASLACYTRKYEPQPEDTDDTTGSRVTGP